MRPIHTHEFANVDTENMVGILNYNFLGGIGVAIKPDNFQSVRKVPQLFPATVLSSFPLSVSHRALSQLEKVTIVFKT